MAWCGYIDMLGTRAMASRSAEELIRNLDYFHGALAESFPSFKGGLCSAFSDGAFFVSKDSPSDFHPFFIRIRNMLFQHGLFFRCSYIEGDIPMIDNETDESGVFLTQKAPSFRSFTFSGSAPVAYQCESTFKGIGCTIGKSQGKSLPQTISSFFLKSEGNRTSIVQYTDFSYSEFELIDPQLQDDGLESINRGYPTEQPIVDQTIFSCHTALTQSATVGSYFVPVFVAMIRSSNLEKIEFDNKTGKWSNAPYLFQQLIDGGATKALKDLPGLHLLLLATYDKLFRDCDGTPPRSVQDRVIARLMRYPTCFRNLDQIPEHVISGKARSELVKLRAAITLKSPSPSSKTK